MNTSSYTSETFSETASLLAAQGCPGHPAMWLTLGQWWQTHTVVTDTTYLNIRKPQVILVQGGKVDRREKSNTQGNSSAHGKRQNLPKPSVAMTF
jgi:hypothetical protein